MRAFEKIKEKYKDGFWEGYDGYSLEDMFNDIEFLIGFGEEGLKIKSEEELTMNLEKIQWLIETLKVIGLENDMPYRDSVIKTLLKELGIEVSNDGPSES